MTDREVVELQARRQEALTLKLRSPTASWTHKEIVSKTRSNSPLAEARLVFDESMHNIIELIQDEDLGSVEKWRLEFQAVVEIAQALGLKVIYETTSEGSPNGH